MPCNWKSSFSYRAEPDFVISTFPDWVATVIPEYSSKLTVLHCKSIKKNTNIQLLSYISSVQKSVPGGFGEMLRLDVALASEVRDGAGDFDNAGEGPG